MQCSELFAEIATWACAVGASDLHRHEGLWRGETDEWVVEINGHDEEVDGLPFAHARISNKNYLALAIVSPAGGGIVGGFPELEIIEHFRAAAKAEG